jgi:PAS domain S-box-containing protein
LDISNTNFELKLLFFKLQLLGLAASVYLWFVFVSVYTQFDRWINKFSLSLMAVVPLYFLFCVFKAPESTSVYHDYLTNEVEGVVLIEKVRGIGFFIWTSYAYSTLGGGMILLILKMLNMPSQQRRQIFVLAPAVLIIIIPNFLYLSGRSVFFPYDPTPVALAIVGILFLLSIYIHKFIEVMPVAHAQVFKNMRSAVIIIDSRDKIMEINPAAERIFNKLQTDIVGKNVLELLPECEKLIKGGIFYNEIKTEIELQNTGRIFELKINSLDDTKGHNTGRVILLFDITEQKEALNELDAYARTVAHDLKNPLNIILGHAQLIEEGCVENKDLNICRYLKGLTQGAMHMNDIIEALLLLAQVRNIDRVDAHPVDIKLNLNTALQRLEANIKESNATIIQSEEMIDSYGHNIWIQEVWVNLKAMR